jgi:hypothetical protein
MDKVGIVFRMLVSISDVSSNVVRSQSLERGPHFTVTKCEAWFIRHGFS